MKRVYAFGTFDGIHPGHRFFLRQAKVLGDHLTVIVARDANVRRHKGAPMLPEDRRRRMVEALGIADTVRLGDEADSHDLLVREPIDVLCLGYDQWRDADVQALLRTHGQTHITVIRARPFFPWLFRGRLLRRLGLLGIPRTPGNVDKRS